VGTLGVCPVRGEPTPTGTAGMSTYVIFDVQIRDPL
jgi:hypothetical protein